MASFQARQFKTTFIVTAGVFLVVLGYLALSTFRFQSQYISAQSQFLEDFTQRAMTRLKTRPESYLSDQGLAIGDKKMQLLANYPALQKIISAAPDKDALAPNQINLFMTEFGGLFEVSEYLLIYPVETAGQTYYAYLTVLPDLTDLQLNSHLSERLQPAIFVGVVVISILFFAQLIQISRVGRMINELAGWADTLSTSKKFKPPPKMAISGMNYLAHTMSNSLNTFSHLLEKEHSFARFTSHELRTQVAVLSANMEILEMIMRDLTQDERKVLNRMIIAIEDMKYQTEALLWLSKETEHELEFSACDLAEVLNKAVEENRYLLDNKAVKVLISGGTLCIQSHPTLLQIAVNNLIRNAFQNTANGLVHIAVSTRGFTVINTNTDGQPADDKRTGFGIGLVLVERIIERLELAYHTEILSNGRSVEISVP